MPSSTYKPLTGREIREIAKFRIGKEIDSMPYLREGNSFHNVNVQIGILMTAYPEDVPVPNLDLNFDIPSDIDKLETSINQVKTAEDLAKYIERLDEHIANMQELQTKAIEARNNLVFETEVEQEFNGNQPDKTRVENNLPVTVEKIGGGKRGEVKVDPVEFKKMAKL